MDDKTFFRLQVANRTVKRLTKEVCERVKEVSSEKAAHATLQNQKAAKNDIQRAKDHYELSDKTLKVTAATLAKACSDAETFMQTNYPSELEQVKRERLVNTEEGTTNVVKEIRETVSSLESAFDLCPDLRTNSSVLLRLSRPHQQTQREANGSGNLGEANGSGIGSRSGSPTLAGANGVTGNGGTLGGKQLTGADRGETQKEIVDEDEEF